MLRNLPQYRSRDSQSFRSSIRQGQWQSVTIDGDLSPELLSHFFPACACALSAFEKLHYWPLEATRPEVLVLKQNDFLKMVSTATQACIRISAVLRVPGSLSLLSLLCAERSQHLCVSDQSHHQLPRYRR